jgi:hypothetical protein
VGIRRAASLARPLILFSAPFWLARITVTLPRRSVVSASIDELQLHLWDGQAFSFWLILALGLVVPVQVFMTLARLSSLTDALAERRRTIGRAAFLVILLLGITAVVAATSWRLIHFMGDGEVNPTPGVVTHVAIALAVAGIALETSRRGPWSGLIALFGGATTARMLSGLVRAWMTDNLASDHLAEVLLAFLGIGILVVGVLVYLKQRGGLPRLRRGDALLLPFAAYALSELALGLFQLAIEVDKGELEGPGVRSVVDAIFIAACVLVVRRIEAEPRTLARAGLGAIFRREELALLPLASMTLAGMVFQLRLVVATSGSDPYFSATSAESVAHSSLTRLGLYVVGFAVLAGLGPYLRWIERQDQAEAS